MEHQMQEYLEINMYSEHVITSVVVQGRYGNGLGQEYTELYVLMYWKAESQSWVQYSEGDNKLLQANHNTYQAVLHRLRGPTVVTSKVRIYPFSYHPRTVCLRVELKGCRAANLDFIKNQTENYFQDFSEQREDWSESSFLGASIGIMSVVGLITVSAIILVIRSNWKLKNYSNIYNSSNKDNDSSIQSSLKRGEDCVSVVGSLTSESQNYDNYVRLQHCPPRHYTVKYVP